MAPEGLVRFAEAVGIDLRALARNFRSVMLTAREAVAPRA